MDVKAVAGDKQAMEMGKRLYLTYCMQCHGADARGAKGFPNLTDSDWLYGGEPEQIKETIRQWPHGRDASARPAGCRYHQGSG
jgi:cytochrome c oxidase cbb3-type subunit 3